MSSNDIQASSSSSKRINEDDEDDNNCRELVAVKKPKLLRHESIYLENLPSCEAYEKSYMHRDFISHVHVTKTHFLITASIDGHIKFWKKTKNGIDFVKNFKSHVGAIEDMSVNASGGELVTISREDKSVKIFDIINFDMINMLSLEFEPKCIEWIHTSADGNENVVISDANSHKIHVFDAKQSNNKPKRSLEHLHSAIVCRMRYNPKYRTVVSFDLDGQVEYWRTNERNYEITQPPLVKFSSKSETDLTIFGKNGDDQDKPLIKLHNINFSYDNEIFVTTSSDRIIRIFRFRSGKVYREYDETLEKIQKLQQTQPIMDGMNFARRMAIERELDRNAITRQENAIFDESGNFILYPTMLGVKVMNWRTDRLVNILGKEETNFRPLSISLFQGLVFEKMVRKLTADSLESGISDPTLYCSAHKKNRFYCFSNRNFEEDITEGEGGEVIKDRDIFNEKPTREEIMAAVELEQQEQQQTNLSSSGQQQQKAHPSTLENATIHTTMGDIHVKLFPKYAPKACENFSTHSRNNYYNNHIFHRVIKQFMIQTGDPTGTGTGGESIWDGDEFEDEFCDELSHDKPYTLSMANCGPNTNGSQFFITVAPCPFLDKKHTIFGRVTKGMDICLNISKVKTDPRTDKPYTDIKIINIKVF